MLWTIAVVLLVLWALGLVTSYTMGGFIHILLAVAIIMVLIRVIQGRRVVCDDLKVHHEGTCLPRAAELRVGRLSTP